MNEGWGWVGGRKWHYFGPDGRALCGKWINLRATLEQGGDNSPDNCSECRKRKAKRDE